MNRREELLKAEAWMRAFWRMLWRFILYVLLIAGAIYVLGRLRSVVISLFVAAILAYVIRPMAGWLAHRRVVLFSRRSPMHKRRAEATLWVLVLLFVGGFFATKMMATPFVEEVKRVVKNWDVYKDRFDKYNEQARGWYEDHVSDEWRAKIEKAWKENSASGDVGKRIAAYVGEMAKHAGELLHNVVEIVLLPVLAFYFALDSKQIKHEFVGILPARRRREVVRMVHAFNLIMFSFVVGQAILCTLAGVVVGAFLALLHVPYSLMLGILAGVTRAIPIIGPIIGGIPIVLLTLVTQGPGTAAAVLAFFTLLHFAESKFIMPMLIGDRMELHPVVIIVVLLIGQEFGGLLGMFFAAPVAAILRVIVRRYWLRTHHLPTERPASAAPIPLDLPDGA